MRQQIMIVLTQVLLEMPPGLAGQQTIARGFVRAAGPEPRHGT